MKTLIRATENKQRGRQFDMPVVESAINLYGWRLKGNGEIMVKEEMNVLFKAFSLERFI
jgi:hypothetical protein